MAHNPYPLYGFESGFRRDREPWLLPRDAFSRIDNACLFRNRLQKRPTAKRLSKLGTKVVNEALGTNAAGQLCGNTTGGSIPGAPAVSNLAKLVNLPLVPPTTSPVDKPITLVLPPYQFRVVGPALSENVYALEWFAGTALAQPYTAQINVATGAWFVQLTAPDAFTVSACTATYEFYRGLPVMMIQEWIDGANSRQLVVCDTKRLFTWNSSRRRFDDRLATVATLATDDVWGGGAFDFHSAATVDDGSSRKLVITNGSGSVRKWSGTVLAAMGMGTTGITAARLVLSQYGHVIYLIPTIAGSPNYQRAMWMDQFLTETGAPINFAVVFSGERIVSAVMHRDEILVFFERSIRKLRYTGDPTNGAAFEWVHVAGGESDRADSAGSVAAMSAVSTPERVVAVGQHGIVATNGQSGVDMTREIAPDLMEKILDATKMSLSYGVVFDQQSQAWFTGVRAGSDATEPNVTVVLDQKLGTLSFYDWPFRCFGLWRKQESVPAWDDVPWANDPLDSAAIAPDSVATVAGFPSVLGGTLDGSIYEIPGDGNVDELGASTLYASSAQLNPFTDEGGPWLEADLDALLLYLSPQSDGELRVRLFRDQGTAPYASYDLAIDPTSGQSKIIKKISANRVARWHAFELVHTSDRPFAVDAIVPFFQAGGPMDRL